MTSRVTASSPNAATPPSTVPSPGAAAGTGGRSVDRWATAVAALAVLGLWLVTRPYRGVRHDGVYYLGQVFDRLNPERMHADLFFAYGSQDRWSIFSPLMAPLVAHLGVGASQLAVLLACHLLFMWGCWLLVRDWPSTAWRWAAMGAVAVLPHTYGGLGAFGFAEPFLTARSLAEPFALFALYQLQRGRIAPALLAATVSVAFHPLIALPVLVIGWVFLMGQDRRWAWAALALLVPAVLGALGIAPFDALWRRFDPAWWDAMRQQNANAFLADYRLLDAVPVVFDALVLGLFVRRHPQESLGRMARATGIAVVALTLLWFLGADVMHDVLLVQLQLWRVYWPLHLLALLVLPRLAVDYWGGGWVGRWCAAALAMAGIGVMSNWPTGWLLVLWALAALAAGHWRAKISTATAQAAFAASLATIVVMSYKVAATTLQVIEQRPDRFDGAGPVLVLLGLPAVGIVLGLLVMRLLAGPGWRRAGAALVALGLVAFGAASFDQRSPWQRELEDASGPRPFDDVLPLDANVYWDDGLEVPWLLARRADFYSPDQGAGLLFNRGTAIEFGRRREALKGIKIQKDLCLTLHGLMYPAGSPPTECVPTVAVVQEACQSTPHPDWIVLTDPLPASVPRRAEWHIDLPGPRPERKSYHLYACSALH